MINIDNEQPKSRTKPRTKVRLYRSSKLVDYGDDSVGKCSKFYHGIGVYINFDNTILKVSKNSPAYKLGIKKGDTIRILSSSKSILKIKHNKLIHHIKKMKICYQ